VVVEEEEEEEEGEEEKETFIASSAPKKVLMNLATVTRSACSAANLTDCIFPLRSALRRFLRTRAVISTRHATVAGKTAALVLERLSSCERTRPGRWKMMVRREKGENRRRGESTRKERRKRLTGKQKRDRRRQ